jgi:hypothetical protein
MQIRKWTLAAAVAMAAVVPLSLSTVAQAATRVDALTISKVKGTNVKAKAVLTTGLEPKTDATFKAGNLVLNCTSASMSFKVKENFLHSATLSQTKDSIIKCQVPKALKADVKSLSVTMSGEPYTATISDRKGDPVSISGHLKATVTAVTTVIGTVKCVYTAKSVRGDYNNKHQTISFSKQAFTLAPTSAGSNAECASVTGTSKATYSAVFQALKDTSVKGKPRVFVN